MEAEIILLFHLLIYSNVILNSFLNSGGGEYDEKGIKTGNWIDIHESSYDL